ncbi:MAG: hypothetical protein ACXU8S_10665 [Phenylobacterium sp.]
MIQSANPSHDRAPDAAWAAQALSHWLVEGGDDRLLLDPETGLNRYGCGPAPDDSLMAFGSSTASTISGTGAAAVDDRLLRLGIEETEAAAWAAGAPARNRPLPEACRQPPGSEERLILSPSGTDALGLAAELVRGEARDEPLAVILPEPAETGRGAPAALCPEGAPITVAVREADGRPRPVEAIDAEVAKICADEIGQGRRVLICLLDVSKTGLIAPSPAAARALKARHGERLSVLVDACQFRLGAASLAAYLDAGFDVAITGSKFLSGPTFSGALLRPSSRPVPPEAHEAASLGVLLRWEAALAEFDAFRAVPDAEVARIVEAFGAVVEAALDASPAFERLALPPLRRLAPHVWDDRPTIFSFLPRAGGRLLNSDETQSLFARLRGVRLGQPVRVGVRDGQAVSALRVALSARQIVAAARRPGALDALTDGLRDTLARTEAQIA